MSMSFGFPRMHREGGERRDVLPGLVARLVQAGCPVLVERGIGSGMGYADRDYLSLSPLVTAVDERTAFDADVVVVLRAPDDRLEWMRPGAVLVSMLHFPTRPGRINRLAELWLDAISLDSIVDDGGNRLVEDMRAVAWNGVGAAFEALARTYRALTDPCRGPLGVTVMGAGTVAKHAIEAATKYGSLERQRTFLEMHLPGVVVHVVGRNMTEDAGAMRRLFASSDVLVDATQRDDPSRVLVPNAWLASLPRHAVICDLVVDPYLDADPPTVRGIEGIPQGNLDQWTFAPDDPAWCPTVPVDVPSGVRRTVVSCYSWPGIYPEASMRHYGRQLAPLLLTLVERGGVDGLRSGAGMRERALRRASLRSWLPVAGGSPRISVGGLAEVAS